MRVLVTGGAGFLGRAFCEAYAEFGADVAVLDIDGKAAEEFAAALAKASGRRCLGVACDIADPGSVRAAERRVAETLGPVRVLHNNAANQSAGLKAEFAPFVRLANVEEFVRKRIQQPVDQVSARCPHGATSRRAWFSSPHVPHALASRRPVSGTLTR
jgi:NAD(P)-dependent dehydrogenase (short-subunit alcohol dehydrogenase family)